MKNFVSAALVAAAMAAVSMPGAALAQDEAAAVEVTRGAMLYSSDGKRIGNVYRVSDAGDAQLIYRGKMITIEASTLSDEDGKLTTSLTKKEIGAIR